MFYSFWFIYYICWQEDLDLKVLKIQNKNLSERLIQRQRTEAELRAKIDKLSERKLADESKICVLDRYWTQLDADLRALLERFDSGEAKSKSKEGKSAVRSFLLRLNDWDKPDVEEHLKDRLKFTTQTVARLVTNYDKYARIWAINRIFDFFAFIFASLCKSDQTNGALFKRAESIKNKFSRVSRYFHGLIDLH